MLKNSVVFRARARTIDHLGKGQIADCPTAVSELWKNSYDAYARNVALHTFDGTHQCAAIIDNGCGMTLSGLIDSWLVVGTESKSTKKGLAEEERFGLPERKTQGEKGIGRLSSAFLAPVTLLVTKKIGTNFSIALVDWRLFENTYLSLSDIDVPIAQIDSLDELINVFPSLLARLKSNIYPEVREGFNPDRVKEIKIAWERFSNDQRDLAKRNNTTTATTAERIGNFCDSFILPKNIYTTWQSQLDRVEELDGDMHGTALFLLQIERELSLLTNSDGLSKENFEVTKIEQDLIDTLRAFVDPFKLNEKYFQYEIKTFSKTTKDKILLRQTDVFSFEDFVGLEHVVQGRVDEKGWFSGTVKAFGKDLGQVRIPPNIEIDKGTTKVGPFSINLGTFENDQEKSSHSDSEFALLAQQTNKYTGLMIFRDELRVLPYGRADNDFFEIEERRGKNAGRYYWARRRTFGQILISQEENSLLKDKAGREGFIKNQAARELRVIVEDLLTSLADRYFGKKSDARQEMLTILKKERDARKEAQTKARSQTQKAFLADLRLQEPVLFEQIKLIRILNDDFPEDCRPNEDRLEILDEKLQGFEAYRSELKTPQKPPKLGDFEESYRNYRDLYSEYCAHISSLKLRLHAWESTSRREEPSQIARRHFDRNQALISAFVNKKINNLVSQISRISDSWAVEAKQERSAFYSQALIYVDDVTSKNLGSTLNSLDATYGNLLDTYAVKYEGLTRALDRLEAGINIDSAYSMAEEEKTYFEEKAKNLQSLAQLGISVEILAHELEELDGLVTNGLNSLPAAIKTHPGFKSAFNAHKALTHQIRFLSPLKLSGYQQRRDISGKDIEEHLKTFFGDRFIRQRTKLSISEAFLNARIKDLPSRIYPVYINLLNNSLYWVTLSEYREIKIDVIDGEVVIGNSGPAIDVDDVPRLFELYYTRRSNGNGVGLYLCKENLAVAHHKIRYGMPGDKNVIENGANFVISFNGMEV
jgi:signal transduction histidine kinase